MEDVIGSLICVGIFVGLGMLPIWVVLYLRLSHALQKAGARYHGLVSSTTILSNAKLRFAYGDAAVTVQYRRMGRKAGGKQTEIKIQTPIRRTKFEAVHRMGRFRFWWRKNHSGPWQSGQQPFDQMFALMTNDSARMDQLFTAGVRWQMTQLANFLSPGLYCSLFTGELIIAKPRMLLRTQQLDDFIRLSLELYDQFMLAEAIGIEFDERAAVIDEVNCPICLASIKGNLVLCVRCRTPHCHECWHYNGKCATFACDETRYVYPVAPTQAAPANLSSSAESNSNSNSAATDVLEVDVVDPNAREQSNMNPTTNGPPGLLENADSEASDVVPSAEENSEQHDSDSSRSPEQP